MPDRAQGAYSRLDLLDACDWGLVVHDEVHLPPAPIFRMTAISRVRGLAREADDQHT